MSAIHPSIPFLPPPADWLVCFALPDEAAPFREASGARTRILLTGMGRTNARARFTEEIERRRPALVLTCGYAGALDPDLDPATVCFDPPEACGLALRLLQAGALPARFHCADRIAVTAVEKARLRAETGAQVVEMESGEIRSLCEGLEIPCVTVRAITDGAMEDLPLDFNRILTHRMRLSPIKLAWRVMLRPWCVPGLLRLRQASREAGRELARVLLSVMGRE